MNKKIQTNIDLVCSYFQMATNSDYSIVNVQDVVELIQNLSNFGTQVFFSQKPVTFRVVVPVRIPGTQITVDTPLTITAQYLLTIVNYTFSKTTDYLLIGSLVQGTESDPRAKGKLPTIVFSSVAAGVPVVLISAVQNINALFMSTILLGNNVYSYFKSEPYLYDFYVNDTDRLREHKSAILNLFTSDQKTFVVWDSFVVHFILRDNIYQPVFYGLLDKVNRRIETKVVFDWCDGVLIGKIGRQVMYYTSKQKFRLTNYYPFLENNSDSNTFTIEGGCANYISQVKSDPLTGKALAYEVITIANKYDYQVSSPAPPYQLDTRYVPLFSPIEFQTADGISQFGFVAPAYLIGFSDVNTFYASACSEKYQPITYAVFQSTNYKRIQNVISQSVYRVQIVPSTTPNLKTKTITVGCLTITFSFSFSSDSSQNNVFLLAFDDTMSLSQFIESVAGSVSIDQLTKVPFYTDDRVVPSNYYSRQLEVPPNDDPPTAPLQTPASLSDTAPYGVFTYDSDRTGIAGTGIEKKFASFAGSRAGSMVWKAGGGNKDDRTYLRNGYRIGTPHTPLWSTHFHKIDRR